MSMSVSVNEFSDVLHPLFLPPTFSSVRFVGVVVRVGGVAVRVGG